MNNGDSIAVTVLFFSHLKTRVGAAKITLQMRPADTVAELKQRLSQDYPELEAAMHTVIVSINREFAFDHEPLPDGAEIAIFPPVSGGSTLPTIFKITHEALDLDALVAQITLNTTGAACVFTGMVRGETQRGDAHQTVLLEYEAYLPMAEAKMAQVAQEIRERWPAVEGIVIVQRIGPLLPGTPTVLIACSAAHRDTGVFEAARYGIDRLKEIVPVWKKEVGPNGETWVEGEYHPQPGDRGQL
jgi:molybdopterin synthase catalytic subunit